MAGFRITDCTARRAPGRLMRRIDKLARGLIEERLGGIGLSYSQWACLKLTAEGEVSTAGELAFELGFTTGATTRLIDGLEAQHLIVRARDLADRRSVRLAVTDAGRELVEAGRPIAIGIWNELVVDFDQEEADRLVDLLVKLLATVERKAGDVRLSDVALPEAAE